MKLTSRPIFIFALVLLAALAGPWWTGQARAFTCTITLGGGTDWNIAANWDGLRLPNTSDYVCIPVGSNVTYSGGATTVAGINVQGTLTLSTGTLTLTNSTQMSNATNLVLDGGTLDGPASVEVQHLTWNSGSMTGTGTTKISGAGTATLKGDLLNPMFLGSGRTLSNYGTVVFADGAALQDAPAAGTSELFHNGSGGLVQRTAGTQDVWIDVPVQNDGAVTITSGNLRLNNTGGPTASSGSWTVDATANPTAALEFYHGEFILTGAVNAANATVRVSGATLTTGPTFNVGTLNVSGGTLDGSANFNIGSLDWTSGTIEGNGSLTIPSGATWTIHPSTFDAVTLGSGRTFAGTGTVEINGTGTVNWASNGSTTAPVRLAVGDLNVSGSPTLEVLTFDGGTLGGTGTLTVRNLNWSYGAMEDAGETIIPMDGTLTIYGNTSHYIENGHTLTVDGSAAMEAGGLIINAGGRLRNVGTFTMSGLTDIAGVGGLPVQNTGQWKVTGGNASVDIPFDNLTSYGSVDIQAGQLTLSGGTFTPSDGSWTVTGTLELNGGSYSMGAMGHLNGTGTVMLSHGATLLLDSSGQIGELILPSGTTMDGAGTLAVQTDMQWYGATMKGTGNTVIAPAAHLTVSGSGSTLRGTRQLSNMGTGTLSDGSDIQAGDTAVIDNMGTWEMGQGSSIMDSLGGTLTFSNSGTLRGPTAGDSAAIQATVTNSGVIEVPTGNLYIDGTLTNLTGDTLTGGTYRVLNGGTLHLPGEAITTLVGATVVLDGGGSSIEDSLSLAQLTLIDSTSSLSVTDGASLYLNGALRNDGALTIDWGSRLRATAFNQTATGHFTAQVAGVPPEAMSLMDLTEGSATLGGTFTLTPLSGFTPEAGMRIPMITFGSSSGAFASTDMPLYALLQVNPADLTVLIRDAALSLTVAPTNTGPEVVPGGAMAVNLSVVATKPYDAASFMIAYDPAMVTFDAAGTTCQSGTTPVNCAANGLTFSAADGNLQVSWSRATSTQPTIPTVNMRFTAGTPSESIITTFDVSSPVMTNGAVSLSVEPASADIEIASRAITGRVQGVSGPLAVLITDGSDYSDSAYLSGTGPGPVDFAIFDPFTSGVTTLEFMAPGYLTAEATVPADFSGLHDTGTITVTPGDLDNSGTVDETDLALAVAQYRDSDPTLLSADVNHDGVVDLKDFVPIAHSDGVTNETSYRGTLTVDIGAGGPSLAAALLTLRVYTPQGWTPVYVSRVGINPDGTTSLSVGNLPAGEYWVQLTAGDNIAAHMITVDSGQTASVALTPGDWYDPTVFR